jgi:Bacterial regulatory protein, arsR family
MPSWFGTFGVEGPARVRLLDDDGQGILRSPEDPSPLEIPMSELSDTLLSGLIDEAFKNLTGEERLAFVERLFARVPTENQQRLIRALVSDLAAESGRPGPDPEIEAQLLPLGVGRRDLPPRDIGPWRTCCRMMAEVDRASRLDGLDADRPARVFGALGDETRVRIIKLLSGGEERVDDLTRTLGTPQSTVSHHLRVLKEAGLVHAEKRGRSIYYSIAPSED